MEDAAEMKHGGGERADGSKEADEEDDGTQIRMKGKEGGAKDERLEGKKKGRKARGIE